MGCIYQQGRIWWIKYYRGGKPYYESTRTDKKEIARRLLKRREGEIAKVETPRSPMHPEGRPKVMMK